MENESGFDSQVTDDYAKIEARAMRLGYTITHDQDSGMIKLTKADGSEEPQFFPNDHEVMLALKAQDTTPEVGEPATKVPDEVTGHNPNE